MNGSEAFAFLPPLLPVDFFSVSFNLPYIRKDEGKKLSRLLPSFSSLQDHESFAEVALGWSEEGIIGFVDCSKPFEDSTLPLYSEGDSLELFLDTRDRKEVGFATRFCHHFVILAHPVQEVHALEVTKFRTDDTHPLCDSSLFQVRGRYEKSSYRVDFFIPQQALHGFEPQTFPRLGVCFKVNRYKGQAQHFTLSSESFDIMQQPSLWASAHLIKN